MADGALTTYGELAEVIENVPLLLRETRRARRLSLRAAGDAIGVSFATVARVESGVDAVGSSLLAILRWLDAPAGASNEGSRDG